MPDFQFSFNGASWGDGTLLDLVSVRGLGLPELRSADVPRAGAHGAFWSRSWANGRTITMEIEALASTAAVLESVWGPLRAALVPAAGLRVLEWGLPGQVGRRMAAECRRAEFVVDEAFSLGAGTLLVEFYAPDPRQYASTLKTLSAGLPTVSGGLSFPASAPFVFGSAGSGGSIAATNDGTIEAPYVAVFTGPLVAPTLTHTGQARTLSLSGASLAAGETLVLDSAARTVLLNGSASRFSWLSSLSQWFTLEPGANALQFNAASGSGSCQVAFRDAWL